MPFLPTWSVVFLIWCVFLAHYDRADGAHRPLRWLLGGLLSFLVGAVMSISVWSYFFFFWIAVLALRLTQCIAAIRALPVPPSTPDPDQQSFRIHQAAWFHGQMLALFFLATTAAALSCYHKHGRILP